MTGFLTTRLICKVESANTVNQHFFAAIYFHIFVFMDIVAVIYFLGLQNWTLLEQCRECLYGHFHSDLLSQISLPREHKSLAKIYWLTANAVTHLIKNYHLSSKCNNKCYSKSLKSG